MSAMEHEPTRSVEPTRHEATGPDGPPRSADGRGDLEARIVEVLRTIFDPEIPVNIHELGLIYGIEIADDLRVTVRMTLTAPACPAAEILPGEVETKVRAVDGVNDVIVELVWDPPWSPDRMTETAKLQLGML